MAPSARSDVERSSRSIRSTLERLRDQVRDTKRLPVPGDHSGPGKWLALIEGLIDTAELHLDKLQAAPPEDPPSELRRAANITRHAYRLMKLIEGAGLNDIPYPLVGPLQRWFSDLGVDNTIVFTAVLDDNYEIDPQPKEWALGGIRAQSQSLIDAIDEIDWDLLRVTIPSKAFSYLPHSAIVAHEIGHALYNRIRWQVREIYAPLSPLLSHLITPVTATHPFVVQHAKQIFFKWHEELVADAVSFYLAGPAAFFALSDSMGYSSQTIGLGRKHPPHALRRRVLYERLKLGGKKSFAAIFEERTTAQLTEEFNSPLIMNIPKLDDIFDTYRLTHKFDSRIAAIFAALSHEFLNIVSVEEIYSAVHDYLDRHHRTAIYSPNDLDQDLHDHLVPLLRAIPPIEIGQDLSGLSARAFPHNTDEGKKALKELDRHLNDSRPVRFSTILNVGWAAILTKHDELRIRTNPESNPDCQKLEQLHRLLLKAVELSEAFRNWRGKEQADGGTVGI